jgi:hypothetical protein
MSLRAGLLALFLTDVSVTWAVELAPIVDASKSVSIEASTPQITALRVAEDVDKTRLVFELSAPSAPVVRSLDGPPRLVIDFPGIEPEAVPALPERTSSRLKKIRSAPLMKTSGLRLIFDLQERATVEHGVLPAKDAFAFRVVVDLSPMKPPPASISRAPTPKAALTPIAVVKPLPPEAPAPAVAITTPRRPAPTITTRPAAVPAVAAVAARPVSGSAPAQRAPAAATVRRAPVPVTRPLPATSPPALEWQTPWPTLSAVAPAPAPKTSLAPTADAGAVLPSAQVSQKSAAPRPAILQVAASSLVLRASPLKEARVVGTAARGMLLHTLEQRAQWYRVATTPAAKDSAWVIDEPIAHGDRSLIPYTGQGKLRYAESDLGTNQTPSSEIGRWRPDNHGRKLVTLPPTKATQIPPPAPNLPRESLPLPDRWRLMQALGFKFPWYDPYHQNVLKGDLPVRALGDDVFANVGVVLDGLGEFREVPIPVNPTVAFGPNTTDAFGDPTQNVQSGTLLLNLALTRGNTTYMPPEYELRFTPVFNYNRAEVREAGVLRADPLDCRTEVFTTDNGSGASDPTTLTPGLPPEDDGLANITDPALVIPTANDLDSNAGAVSRVSVLQADDHCVRHDNFVGIQEFFFDYHLRDVSERYDFDSIRVGIQPFTNDFRGFLFQDLQFGVRLFGNRDNNQWQYNLAWFRRVEKDTNSGLNDISEALREDDLFLANVYRQDFPMVGFTSELSVVHNRNNEDAQYIDTNGFVVRPAIVGSASRRPSPYQVTYLGYAGDGHLRTLWPEARLNLTTATYAALGTQDFNPIAGAPQDVQAFFHASELSRDFSWIRVRGSLLYASGDDDPLDSDAGGFDAIFENPQFAGADTSYWVRQGIPLIGGGAVALSGRNGVLASLRSSKEQGQSNFVNPGLFLIGVGADFDVAPELRVIANANHLWFDEIETLEFLRAQTLRDKQIGYDLSAGIQWRPLFNQNIVINASGAVLLAGRGLRDLYGGTRHSTLYSAFLNAVFAY